MKKLYGFLAVLLAGVLLTGCGSKSDFKCTAKMEENGQTAEAEFDITLDSNDKIKSLDVTMEFEDEETAKQLKAMYDWLNSMAESENDKVDFSQSGKKVTIKNYEKIFSSDSDEEVDEDDMGNVVGMSKDEFKTKLESMPSIKDVSCK